MTEAHALKCWPKCGSRGSHRRKLQTAQHFVVLRKHLLNMYTLVTHEHPSSTFSPENKLNRVPQPRALCLFITLVSGFQGDVLTEDSVTTGKRPWMEPREEHASLLHRDSSPLGQLPRPLPLQACSILPEPPEPNLHQFPLQCSLSITSHLYFMNHHGHTDDQRTPHSHLWALSHQCPSAPPSRSVGSSPRSPLQAGALGRPKP